MKSKERATRVSGVGINDADYRISIEKKVDGKRKVVWECPFYRVWASMIKRCYSPYVQAKQPTYKGCTVAEEWHLFSTFKEWMQRQNWEGKHLDKDILIDGSRTYGPETCVFIEGSLNRFLNTNSAARGKYPVGVSLLKGKKRLMASCGNPFSGKQENLGYFDTPEEAHEAWRKRKHELACRYADMQSDPRVAEALRLRYSASSSLGMRKR